MLAVRATPIRAAQPGDADACVKRQFGCCPAHHLAHDLMAGDQTGSSRGHLAFDDVQIGTAYTAGAYPQKYVSRYSLRIGDVCDLQRKLCDVLWNLENRRFHSLMKVRQEEGRGKAEPRLSR